MYTYIHLTPACDQECFAHIFGRTGCQGIIMKGFLLWMRNSEPDKTFLITREHVSSFGVFFVVLFWPCRDVPNISRYFGFSKVVDLAESFRMR